MENTVKTFKEIGIKLDTISILTTSSTSNFVSDFQIPQQKLDSSEP